MEKVLENKQTELLKHDKKSYSIKSNNNTKLINENVKAIEFKKSIEQFYDSYFNGELFDAHESLKQAQNLVEENDEEQIKNFKDAIQELIVSGDNSLHNSLYKEAISFYKQTLKYYKDATFKSNIFHKIAIAYEQWENYDKAIEYYHKTVKFDSNKVTIYYDLGIIYRDFKGNIVEATSNFNKYLKLIDDKKDSDCFYQLAVTYEEENNIQLVIENLRSAIITEKENDDPIPERLIEYGKKLLKYIPEDLEILIIVGNEYLKSNDLDIALQYFEKALLVNTKCIEAVKGLAIIHKKRKEYIDAISKYQKVIEIEPSDVESLFELGVLHAELYAENSENEDQKKSIEYFTETYRKDTEKIKELLNNTDYPNFIIPLLSATQKKSEIETKLETEKQLLGDLIHIINSALSTGPRSIKKVIDYLANMQNSNSNDKVLLKRLRNANSVQSSFERISGLMNLFTIYAQKPESLKYEWKQDISGTTNMNYLFASIIKNILSRIILSNRYITPFKYLISYKSNKNIDEIQDSFTKDVLTIDIREDNLIEIINWLQKYLPIFELSICEKPFINIDKIRFSFLLVCFSEIIFNAIKYTNASNPISISWKEEKEHFIFDCKNSYNKTQITGTQKGLYFIEQICNSIDGISFNVNKSFEFHASISFQKKLF